jgi:protein-tyrosine phosphatase
MATVLFVCTGNLCRSPSAEWLLNQHFTEQGPDGAWADSVGTVRTMGPPPAGLIAAGESYGMDVFLRGHQPRQLEYSDIEEAELVIGMTRQHVRESVLLDRTSFPRTFTLRELVRRASGVGPRQPDQSLAQWLSAVHGGRLTTDLIGESVADDVDDPMGGPIDEYRSMLGEVSALLDSLVSLVWSPVVTGA